MAIKDHSTAGGRARAAKLSPERRSEIARKAALAGAISTVVNRFPELTPEQVTKLRALLAPFAVADFHVPTVVEHSPGPTPVDARRDRDEVGQLVTVGRYAYRWRGQVPLRVGDTVLLPGNCVRPLPFTGVVTELGSTYTGEHADILNVNIRVS